MLFEITTVLKFVMLRFSYFFFCTLLHTKHFKQCAHTVGNHYIKVRINTLEDSCLLGLIGGVEDQGGVLSIPRTCLVLPHLAVLPTVTTKNAVPGIISAALFSLWIF